MGTQVDLRDKLPSTYILVDSLTDIPSPVAGVRTLGDNITYVITNTFDLLGDRLVCGQNTTILGGSSENCRIKSTGLVGTALITSNWSLPIRNVTIEADIALNLDASSNPNQALDWFGVNFTNCSSAGTIKGYSNFIATDCALLDSGGFTFDGTIGTIGFIQTIFNTAPGTTAITIPATATIQRRIRLNICPFVVLAGETALNISTSASIPVESYILDTCNFSGGGTYISGVQHTDNKALFTENKGIVNSAAISGMFMSANAVVTDIVTQGVAVKMAGNTTPAAINQKFTHSTGRLTYTGAITRFFKVTYTATAVAATANKQIGFYVSKTGTLVTESEQYVTTNANSRAEAVTIQCIIELTTNDWIEPWIENDTDNTDVTVTFLNLIVEPLN